MLEYCENKNLVKIYSENFNKFMDYCIENELIKIIGIFSLSYNLQDYYDYKNINKKFTPIKPNKFILQF